MIYLIGKFGCEEAKKKMNLKWSNNERKKNPILREDL
jgi:hypothetical protein